MKLCCRFRNGSFCCGSSTLLTVLPVQSLHRIHLPLYAFSIPDPDRVRGRFLHLSISIPAEGARLSPPNSRGGDLHPVTHTDGCFGFSDSSCCNSPRKFVLHGVWCFISSAGFQRGTTVSVWTHRCNGDLLFGPVIDCCGRCEGRGEWGWLFKVEEILDSYHSDKKQYLKRRI